MANVDRVDKLRERGVVAPEPPAFVTANERSSDFVAPTETERAFSGARRDVGGAE